MFAPLFLGFDLSTQALKASAISVGSDQVLVSATVNFDKDLPRHNTSNGSIVSVAGDGEITTPVALFLDAVDLVMQRLKDAGLEFGRVLAVGGAAQQHGSVYWSPSATALLANLNPKESLTDQLASDAFSIPNAPIWQDFSTAKECRIIEAAVGGPQALSDLTGSRAYERFTGSQILKVASRTPDVYARTAHISLISSFLTSLFLGKIAPVEIADASGMNLMNVHTCKYDDRLLDACSGGTGKGAELREKLGGEPVMGGTNMGKVSGWWVERFGFNSDCIVTPFTGDNPSSIVMLSSPGDAILSFGTSTTLLVSIPPSNEPPSCTTTSHILSHPTTAGGAIAMLCYKNGGLTRESVRDEHTPNKSWDAFNDLLISTPPGNNSKFGFYFTLREIIPDGVYGEFFFKHTKPIRSEDLSPAEHARAVVESQLMSIKTRLQAILHGNGGVKRCIVTGGSSTNHVMQQVCADVLGLPVYVAEASGSATVGGALLARWGWYRATGSIQGLDHAQNWRGKQDALPLEATREGGGVRVKLVAEPHSEATKVYDSLLDAYQQNENEVVRACRARDATAASKLAAVAVKPVVGFWRSLLGVFGLFLD
ncbi:unnamed protein product [Rhizoctonia solani]|uniref:Xylulose kinase n=1 Tax=Rhizoctonia solani TaxID=456999 RepID=A0A8H3GH69_9AGAM|nr:unnamed protein product [Rhizoctonia solani]CAE6474722.1 unnamed protein product [Rhizoctonia solani]